MTTKAPTAPGRVVVTPPARLIRVVTQIPWLSLASLAVAATVWEILGRARMFEVLPPLTEIGETWLQLYRDGEFDVVLLSLQTFAIGILLAIGAALLVAIVTSLSRTIDYVLKPVVDVAMSLPITAVIPILMIIFGLGQATRVAVVFLYSFFIIVVNMQAGIRSVDPAHVEMARAFAAPQSVVLTRIVLRSATPMVIEGVRLGIIRGLKGMINAEVIIGTVGIGALLIHESHSFNIPAVFAVTATIVTLAMILILIVSALERVFLRWRR